MPVNRNALIRYKTIDKCLQNRYRKWMLDDLIEACSDALYEYEGIDKGVSRRTTQSDIQIMRSDKLGYNAPIIVVDRKYYTYEDPNYSITNIPLSDKDLGMLTEMVEFMKQFQGFSHFRELDGMVQKLEDHIYAQKTDTKPVIDFEKNENLKGLQYLDSLYRAIISKKPIQLTYKSFKAKTSNTFDFHPYVLKEFRNRWFIVGQKGNKKDILNLALDRIINIAPSEVSFNENKDFDSDTYFNNVIGVTVSPTLETEKVQLFVINRHAPYVITKPLHHSQKVVERNKEGIIISLKVQHNFELEKEILALGDGIKVISPKRLKDNIKKRIQGAMDLYETELNKHKLKTLQKRLTHKGFAIFAPVYTQNEISKIKGVLSNIYGQTPKGGQIKALTLEELPTIINRNMRHLIRSIDTQAQLTNATLFDKTPTTKAYTSWHQSNYNNHQDSTEGFIISILLDDMEERNGTIQVIHELQNKVLSTSEINAITEKVIPLNCDLPAGGVYIRKALTLHRFPEKHQQYRIIELRFEIKNE